MKVGRETSILARWKIKIICHITHNSLSLLRLILHIIIYLQDLQRGWKDKTPTDFRFSLKFPKIITHERKLEDVIKPLSALCYSLEPLIDKTLTLLIQLPPFLSEKRGFTSLQDMLHHLDKRFGSKEWVLLLTQTNNNSLLTSDNPIAFANSIDNEDILLGF